ncbi:MAG: ParB N-terminal domain-containing protein [Caulobacter sp.]|nr:ParB N-terminal domain-containing protein [Caulobacter sp.]
MNAHISIDTAAGAAVDPVEHGVVRDIPLDKLKKSPKNARKVPHTDAAIEALAASIKAKGILQMPVVEPEYDGEGEATGYFLVTIGEGRRLAQRLRAKRKQIRKTHPVRCLLDLSNDPHEISLDENVTRSAMHPADQFEAFRDLADRKGWGAEEIGARFGVSAHVVRQRLRLGAVSPKLMAIYREDGLTLDQLMAFAVSEDHDRQDQVYEQNPYNRQPHAIRRMMTQDMVPAHDHRARFVGLEAYAEAGGPILRDLFTETGEGWLEDVGLLERLAAEKVAVLAEELRAAEGWKWAEGHVDYPSGHGLARVYAHKVERGPEDVVARQAIADEYDALVEAWAAVEDLPPEVEAQFNAFETRLAALGEDYAYDPDDVGRGGLFVVVAQDGTTRIERGFIRAEDMAPDPEPDDADAAAGAARPDAPPVETPEAEEPDGLTPLSDRLVADLTAHRTAALRDRLAEHPDVALVATIHVLVLRAFYAGQPNASCLDIRLTSASLSRDAEGIEDGAAEQNIAARHTLWARQLPQDAAAVWPFIVGLDGDSRLSLLAHCVGLSIHAVRNWDRRPAVHDHADALAVALDLDMTAYWSATARSYLGRVTKARIGEAVGQAKGEDAAASIADLKKGPMVEAAEGLIGGTGWLPPLLRTGVALTAEGEVDKPEAVEDGQAVEVGGVETDADPNPDEAAAISDAA